MAHVALTGVEGAIGLGEQQGYPVGLFGPNHYDEVRSYIIRSNRYPETNFVSIGNRKVNLSSLLEPAYKGRLKTLRRISSFLTSFVMADDERFGELLTSRTQTWPEQSISEVIVNAYVSSRKNPDGSLDQILDFLSLFNAVSLPAPLVLTRYYYGWTAEQVICLASVLAKDKDFPVVIVSSNAHLSDRVEAYLATDPVTIGEALDSISSQFSLTRDSVHKGFKIWTASRGPYRTERLRLGDPASSSLISDLAGFISATAIEDNEVGQFIPSRIVAPVMFEERDQFISIDHRPALGISHQNALGGVRAIRNLTQDVLSSGVLSNSVMGIDPCLERIISYLDDMSSVGPIEESSIVEFGVEFSYVESRILNAAGKLSDDTVEFMLAYTGEAAKFLDRFEAWQTYKNEQGISGNSLASVNREVAQAAVNVLRSARVNGILDQLASQKVSDLVSVSDLDDPTRRGSLAATTENLGAAVGRTALSGVKNISKQAAEDLGKDVSDGLRKKAASFIIENSANLLKIASHSSGRWVSQLVRTITDQA